MISKKIMILGEIGVGKTSLVRRYVLDEMPSDYIPTMGVDIYRYTVPASPAGPRAPVELVIWDIDGNYGQSIFRHVYSKGASGALIIGDITRRPTLDLMVDLAHGFQDAMPGRHFSFVVNKLDLLPEPGDADVPEALKSDRHELVWASAKSGANVRHSFEAAAAAIARRED
ncbi:MAG: Rab family GTPase [Hyphomicrobiaceae bacterium]